MTERSASPLETPPATGAPADERPSTNTWPMWIIALLPLTGLLGGAAGSGGPGSTHDGGSPGLRVTVGLIPVIVELVLAAADRRLLAERGVLAPLHWGWALFGPLFVIGRSVVVRRRVRGSLAPLWVWLAASAVVLAVGLLRH